MTAKGANYRRRKRLCRVFTTFVNCQRLKTTCNIQEDAGTLVGCRHLLGLRDRGQRRHARTRPPLHSAHGHLLATVVAGKSNETLLSSPARTCTCLEVLTVWPSRLISPVRV